MTLESKELPDDEMKKSDGGPGPAKIGRRKKKLIDNPKRKAFEKILDEFVDIIEKLVTEQDVKYADFLQDVTRKCYFRWGTLEDKQEPVSVEEATSLIYNLDLSLNKYQELRMELIKKNRITYQE